MASEPATLHWTTRTRSPIFEPVKNKHTVYCPIAPGFALEHITKSLRAHGFASQKQRTFFLRQELVA